MRLSGKIASIAALALATLTPAGIAGAAPAETAAPPVPYDRAVSIDHVATDTHIMSVLWAGNADSAIQLFEDYDAVHGAGEKWYFRHSGTSGEVRIENSYGGRCLQPGNPASATAGTGIVQTACNTGSTAQQWTLDFGGTGGDFVIRPHDNHRLAITPTDNGRYSWLRLGQTDGYGHLNQLFRVRGSDD